VLHIYEGKIHARRTICAFLEHGVFQKLGDNLFPRLEYQFVLVCVPLSLAMYLKGFLDIIVDPLNVQRDVILNSGSILVPPLVKLQFIDFLCRD